MPLLAKACLLSLGLLLSATPAVANCERFVDDFERLGKEYQEAYNKGTALVDADGEEGEREWCGAARVANSKLEAVNAARLKARTCICNNGDDCSKSAYYYNVLTAELMKKETEKVCSKYNN